VTSVAISSRDKAVTATVWRASNQGIRMNCLMVFCNVPDETTARHIAHVLVQEQLAACVNILPPVGRCIAGKAAAGRQRISLADQDHPAAYAALQQRLLALHPYDVPEIIALPVAQGLPAYLTWVSSGSGFKRC
jgi:periplasmic divalent cation tolerance protein